MDDRMTTCQSLTKENVASPNKPSPCNDTSKSTAVSFNGFSKAISTDTARRTMLCKSNACSGAAGEASISTVYHW